MFPTLKVRFCQTCANTAHDGILLLVAFVIGRGRFFSTVLGFLMCSPPNANIGAPKPRYCIIKTKKTTKTTHEHIHPNQTLNNKKWL
jgi:hypothetical protein